MRFIQDGPPVITSTTQTDEPGFEARTLCLVDGFPAEIHHEINTRRQEYSTHTLELFDPATLAWKRILTWGFVEAGHIPAYPEEETFAYLTHLSKTMWGMANVVVHQARLRGQDLNAEQFAAERMEYRRQRDVYDDARYAVEQQREDDFPAPSVDHGELTFDPAEDAAVAAMAAHDAEEAPYTGTEPEDQG